VAHDPAAPDPRRAGIVLLTSWPGLTGHPAGKAGAQVSQMPGSSPGMTSRGKAE
jgi:hypothetical protein